MTTTGRNHLTSSQDRSPFISERRRKLFPIENLDTSDSELGHISPLCLDSPSDSEIDGVDSIVDDDFTDTIQKERRGDETPVSVKACSESMSPLTLSPYTSTFFRCTPKKYSPSQNLKTPHYTSAKPAVLQKEQKTLLKESKSLKRKSSPTSSPEQTKNLKMDCKNSKVRTALFPPEEDIYTPLPTKSFYSKGQEDVVGKRTPSLNKNNYTAKNIKLIFGKHSSKHRKKFGQINNGVWHKIRKPKQRKISKVTLEKAAKKMLETGSVLTEYMQDLKELRNKQNTESRLIEVPAPQNSVSEVEPVINDYLNSLKELETRKTLISTPIKQIQTFPEENKENVQRERSDSPETVSSPKDTKSRKFFKSSRSKATKPTKIQGNTLTNQQQVGINKPGRNLFDLSNGRSQKNSNESQNITSSKSSEDIASKVILDNINDFGDEDMEPEPNIDNILSVLSNDSPQKCLGAQNTNVHSAGDFGNGVENIPDLSQSTSGVCSYQNTMVYQNMEENNMLDVGGSKGEEAYLENSSQASSFDFNYLIPCNNVPNQNMQGLKDISEYQLDTDSQTIETIDSRQYFSNGPSLPAVLDVYNSPLEPCILSSQVIFNNMLLEDGRQTVTKEDGSFLQVSTGIDLAETNGNVHNSNKITLEAYNSVLASENSIQLHNSNVANSEHSIQLLNSNVANAILSPISQMCDVTSGLALNSPKRGRNPFLSNTSRASKILSFTNCNSIDMEKQDKQQQQKLFPVFLPGAKGAPERGEKRERGEPVKRSAKKFKALHEDQMLLDAGQKKFGYTICNECNIVYHMGDPGDENEHMNYHNACHILRFGGWKNEHLISDFQKNGRIIRVLPTDSKIWLKKVKDLMEFVKRQLGCYEMDYDISDSQVYLYIKNRTIAGCAVATVPKGAGHRMLSSLSGVAMCSEESFPIKCGISHIWVATNLRKQRIATSLMDAVKNNFVYGYILTDDDVALTSPTEAGSAFAERYFKTPNYLVYYT